MYLSKTIIDISIAISMIIGALYCFFGYRIFKIIIGILGFTFLGTISAFIAYFLSSNEGIALLTGLIGGLIGIALFIAVYFIGVFFIGLSLGGTLGFLIYSVTGNNPEIVVIIILAIIFGILAVIIQKFMIIISTATMGALSIIFGLTYFAGYIELSAYQQMFHSIGTGIYALFLCWICLGVVGVIIQYKFTSINKEHVSNENSH